MSNALGLIAPQYAAPADWYTSSVDLGPTLPAIVRTGTYLPDQATLDAVVTAAIAIGNPVVYLTIPPMGFTDPRTQNPNAYYPTPALIAEQIANARALVNSANQALWAANHHYTVGSLVTAPDGTALTTTVDHTSGATFDATEAANFEPVVTHSATLAQQALNSAYVADPAVNLTGKTARWYGDSWAAGYGLTAGQSYIQLAATQMGCTTFQNLAVSGSALQSVGGLMIWHGSAYEWSENAANLVVINAGINDARYNDLSLAANRAWLKALKHSLRMSVALAMGAQRIVFNNYTYWTYGGAGWFNGPYPYSTDGTNVAATTTPGNTAVFAFEGDEVTMLVGGYYTDTTCVADFYIDGEHVRTVRFENDQVLYPSSATTVGFTAQRFTGLAPGPHTLQVTKADTTSAALYIDSAFTRSATPPLVLINKEPTLPSSVYSLYSPYNNGNDNSIKAMQKVVDDVASEFTGVRLCNLPVLTPVTDFQADFIHPNGTTGVPKLQAAVVAALSQPGLFNRVEDIAESPRIRRQLTPRNTVVTRFLGGSTLVPYNIPTGAVAIRIKSLGSGGSAGSGRRGAAGTVRCGGGGGSGGGYDEILMSTFGLPPTIYVTAGGSVAGGAAVTTDNTDGNNGTNGVPSYVVTDNTLPANEAIYLSYAPGGARGLGGTATLGTGGASQASRMGLTGNGGSASTTGGNGVATVTNGYGGVGQGGGSGGGITSGNVAGTGGTGWWSGLFITSVFSVPSGGANTGGNGGAGNATTPLQGRFASGPSGGGGGANLSGAGGTGGAGGRGSGGGGGGASVNGNNSGAGGASGEGFVEITAYF